jgi:lipoate---protein ligase
MRTPLARAGVSTHAGLSLGRAQHAEATTALLPRRLRASGGGAVLLGPWLLRAVVVLPAAHPCVRGGPVAAALWFGALHRDWLRAHGIDAQCHEGPVSAHWACFAGRAPGEVLVDGLKLAGIAQTWRRDRVQLWSGTLLSPVPWSMLCRELNRRGEHAQALAQSTTTVQACLGHVPDATRWAAELTTRLQQGVAKAGTCAASTPGTRALPTWPADAAAMASNGPRRRDTGAMA